MLRNGSITNLRSNIVINISSKTTLAYSKQYKNILFCLRILKYKIEQGNEKKHNTVFNPLKSDASLIYIGNTAII